jgi:hypothetical protein
MDSPFAQLKYRLIINVNCWIVKHRILMKHEQTGSMPLALLSGKFAVDFVR